MLFVAAQSLLAYRLHDKLILLRQIGAVRPICYKYRMSLAFSLVQSIILYGFMLVCGLSLLQELSSLDIITGSCYGLTMAWFCLHYFRSATVIKVVKNGALYL